MDIGRIRRREKPDQIIAIGRIAILKKVSGNRARPLTVYEVFELFRHITPEMEPGLPGATSRLFYGHQTPKDNLPSEAVLYNFFHR
jgi:hypothetical protein